MEGSFDPLPAFSPLYYNKRDAYAANVGVKFLCFFVACLMTLPHQKLNSLE